MCSDSGAPPPLRPAGGEVSDRTRRVSEERSVAHRRHTWRGEAALEGSTKRWLEGQNLVPLAAEPPATGGLHQVRPDPDLKLAQTPDSQSPQCTVVQIQQ